MTEQKPFHNPFAGLGALRDMLPQAIASESAPSRDVTSKTQTHARAVVRLERSGRGGKEVTVIEQLELSTADRSSWLAALKSALGCGGSLEGESLMLQGDHRTRLPVILEARGVKKIIVS